MSLRLRCAGAAVLAMALAFTWQFLTVRYSYGGNWTGLFCTGEWLPYPPELAGERIYVFPKSVGYDGQAYHYIAHDPFFRRGFGRYLDSAPLRYRRVLLSLGAWLLAFGQDSRIDAALIAVVLLSIGAGAYWLARFSRPLRGGPWWGLAFLLAPPVLVSIDRILTDALLAALCVGFALYVRERRWSAVWTICMLAALTRETGMALAGGMTLFLLFERRIARAAWFACAILPAIGWAVFCAVNSGRENPDWLGWIPFAGLAWRILTPTSYPLPPWIERVCIALDYVALAGIVLALAQLAGMARRRAATPVAFVLYLFGLLAVFLSNRDAWGDVYAFGRTLAPIPLFLALERWNPPDWRTFAPSLLIDPRIGVQWGKQFVNVATGLLLK